MVGRLSQLLLAQGVDSKKRKWEDDDNQEANVLPTADVPSDMEQLKASLGKSLAPLQPPAALGRLGTAFRHSAGGPEATRKRRPPSQPSNQDARSTPHKARTTSNTTLQNSHASGGTTKLKKSKPAKPSPVNGGHGSQEGGRKAGVSRGDSHDQANTGPEGGGKDAWALFAGAGDSEAQLAAKVAMEWCETTILKASVEEVLTLGGTRQGSFPAAHCHVRGSVLPPGNPPGDLRSAHVREAVSQRWAASGFGRAPPPTPASFVSASQAHLYELLSSYRDVLYGCHPYPTDVAAARADPVADAYLLHVSNHVATCLEEVRKNNARLKAAAEGGNHVEPAALPQDHGFTRPKALLLLPLRSIAFARVSRLLPLLQRETRADSIYKKARFIGEFGPMEGEGDDVGDQPHRARGKRRGAAKPPDHSTLFGGNSDDNFLLPIKVTKGQVRLFADVYDADIIVASPLGAVLHMQAERKAGRAEADFLSSVAVVVVERADVAGMQNWEHVRHVLGALNQQPADLRDADVMRVRPQLLEGLGRYYRHVAIFSSFVSPQIQATFHAAAFSHAGAVKMVGRNEGVIEHGPSGVLQEFYKVPCPEGADAAEVRLAYFQSALWPHLQASSALHSILLFIPSYFDLLRVQEWLKREKREFLTISEYTSPKKQARNRTLFRQGECRLLLYTERAHFYFRLGIRGADIVVMYGLPEHVAYYNEVLGVLKAGGGSVQVLYTWRDLLVLQRVVGDVKAEAMLQSQRQTMLFEVD